MVEHVGVGRVNMPAVGGQFTASWMQPSWLKPTADEPAVDRKVLFWDGFDVYAGKRIPRIDESSHLGWTNGHEWWLDSDVTHWMPLPVRPK